MSNRDLDRRVAEKLGWTNIRPYTYAGTGESILIGSPPDNTQDCQLSDWSTDMNAAMELWEAGWLLTECETGTWHVDMYYDPETRLSTAPTPAEAIVRAFLQEEK